MLWIITVGTENSGYDNLRLCKVVIGPRVGRDDSTSSQ